MCWYLGKVVLVQAVNLNAGSLVFIEFFWVNVNVLCLVGGGITVLRVHVRPWSAVWSFQVIRLP